MLIARASKRDAATQFKFDARVDFILDGEAIGGLVYTIGRETAEITLRGAAYRMARERARTYELLFRMAVRVVRGQEKPGPNPIRLTDAAGRILASAEEAPRGTAISFGGERFAFRRRSVFSPRYDLYAENGEQPLGSAGQRSLFSTSLTAEFSPDLSELLQAFLLTLIYDMTFVALDQSS